MKIGVLALQGDVSEHFLAVNEAARKLKLDCEIMEVRIKNDLEAFDGLIIPGGESTTIYKLCEREGMLGAMKKIKNIFGTCAGAVMLAKKVKNAEDGQKTLALMDIEIDRNAYGAQAESFSKKLDTRLGAIDAVFIRAPKIKRVWGDVSILAKDKSGILLCEQRSKSSYWLASCFHPELSSTKIHEHFLKSLV